MKLHQKMEFFFATLLTGKTTRSLPLLPLLAQHLQPGCTTEHYTVVIIVKTSGNNGFLYTLYSYMYFFLLLCL